MMNEEKTQVESVPKYLAGELLQIVRFVPKSPHGSFEAHLADDKFHLRCCGYPIAR